MSDGANSSPVAAAVGPGAHVTGYLLEEQIGRGGMAVVFRALDERLNRQVALKVMASAQTDDEAFRQRFVRESQAAAAVDDPHIIPIYQAGEADGVLFIAMRLVRGGNLKTLVKQRGALSPARAAWIVGGVASALDAAHARGLVHRDVKPANMLLDVRPGRPDHVYLSDFGVSKAALESSGLTGSGQFLGTVDYAAPEQIYGRPVDGRSDQYALGCAAYELLCGRPPFAGRELLAVMYAQLSEQAPAPSSVRAELPADVDEVFARVLAKDPGDRYETCQDFAAALEAALGLQRYPVDELAGLAAEPDELDDSEDDATLDPAVPRRQAVLTASALLAGRGGGSLTMERSAKAGAAQLLTGTGDTVPGPVPVLGGPGGSAGRRRRTRALLAAGIATVVVLGGAAGALLYPRSPAPAQPYRFGQKYGNLAVSQLWTLTGRNGSGLEVKITASNGTKQPVTAQLEEPIPAAVAASLAAVSFGHGSQPRATLPKSRLVVWLFQLRPGGHATVSYKVRLRPAGATEARLENLVHAFRQVAAEQELEPVKRGKPVLENLVITPSVVQLAVGGGMRLTLGGVMSDASSAPSKDLSKVTWTSSNSSVATVVSGFLFALNPGVTRVTASVGHISASATITVVGPGSGPTGPGYSSNPPQSGSPSGSPTTSGSPSTSPSESGSPTTSSSASSSPSNSPSPSPTSPAPSTSTNTIAPSLREVPNPS